MNHQFAMRRLWWKELRQLLPLVIMLAAIGFLVHILFLFSDDPIRSIVLFGMPSLFAIGAGALIVGQEKELGTLDWLSTLPIAPRDLVQVKLLVCVVGLAVVWLASYLMFWFFQLFDDRQGPNYLAKPTWSVTCMLISQTLFMLLIGVFLAWRFQSSLLALGLLVPIAIIPIRVVDVFFAGADWWHIGFLAWVVGCTLVALIASWRAGLRHLSPARTSVGVGSTQVKRVPARSRDWGPPQTQMTSLLWQFGRQTWALLGAATLLAVFAAVSSNSVGFAGGQTQTLAMLLLVAGVSWLGAGAFVGDRLQDRIRFFADRGVSPTRVWITRHTLPLCVLVVAGVAVGFWVAARTVSPTLYSVFSPTALCLAVGGLWLVYVPSQWIGQLIRSPIVAAMAAPAVATFTVFAVGAAFHSLGTPVWLIALCSCLPMFTTWWLMPKWIDGRLDFNYWLTHTATLALIVILAFVPSIVASWEPGMPDEVQQEMMSFISDELRGPSGTLLDLTVSADDDSEDTDDAHTLTERVEAKIASYERKLDEAGAVRPASRVANFLIAHARRARLAAADSNDSEIQDALVEDYRRTTRVLAKLVTKLRASDELLAHDEAGLIERWLRREAGLQRFWDDSLTATVSHLWQDVDARRHSLQQAVALSWQKWQVGSEPHQASWSDWAVPRLEMNLGGYWLGDLLAIDSVRDQITAKRRIERGIAVLWQLANAGGAATEEQVADLAECFSAPASFYGVGRDEATDATHTALHLGRAGWFIAPGHGWIHVH